MSQQSFKDLYTSHVFDALHQTYDEDTQLLRHPLVRTHLVFHEVWKAFFGVSPSHIDVCAFAAFFQDAHNAQDIVHACIENHPFKEFNFFRSMYNIEEINQKATHTWQMLEDPQVVRTFLLQKWLDRFVVKLPITQFRNIPLPKCFLQILKAAPHFSYTPKVTKYNSVTYVENPFTKNAVEVSCTISTCIPQLHADILRHVIANDHHFLIKLITCVSVIDMSTCCENTTSDVSNTCIQCLMQVCDKKVLVFSTNRDIVQTNNVYGIHYTTPDLLTYVPKLSKTCIVITENLEAPYLTTLGTHKIHNILLSNTPGNSHTRDVFDRHLYTTYNTSMLESDTQHMVCIMNMEHEWKHLLSLSSPFGVLTSTSQNMLLFLDFAAKYCVQHKHTIDHVVKTCNDTHTENVIVMIDNRKNMHSCVSIMLTLVHVPWNVIIYTKDDDAVMYYKKHIPGATVLTHPRFNTKHFDIDIYNDILQDPTLWQDLENRGYTHALIIQDDGMIVRPGIERFLKYDYVGAPWADDIRNVYIKENITKDLVGNGGLSLRRISKMKYICYKHGTDAKQLFYRNMNRTPEDVFFIKHLVHMSDVTLPTSLEASFFSSEQIINLQSIGFHKVWAYNMPDNVKRLFDEILKCV